MESSLGGSTGGGKGIPAVEVEGIGLRNDGDPRFSVTAAFDNLGSEFSLMSLIVNVVVDLRIAVAVISRYNPYVG